MSRRKPSLSPAMQEVLVGISQHPEETAPVDCDGSCKLLINTLGAHAYCLKHRALPTTLQALERRGLLHPITKLDDIQQTLWDDLPTVITTHFQLTDKGRRAVTLVRLGAFGPIRRRKVRTR